MKQRLTFFAIFCSFLCNVSLAQTPKTFPVDDDVAFANAFGQHMIASTRPEVKEMGLWIQRNFLTRTASPEEIKAIKTTANLMLTKKVLLWPNFYNYARLMMQAQTTDLDPGIISKNFQFLQKMLSKDGTESIKQFNAYVDYLNMHYQDKALFFDKAKTWKIDAPYTLDEDNEMPVMLLTKGSLIGTTTADTLEIKETSGRFYPMTNQWMGKSGTVSWKRVGFPEDKVYANFGAYNVDLLNPELNLDSAILTFQPYSDLRIKGKFSDRLNNSRAVAITYPQFQSFENVSIKGLTPELKFESGLALEGAKMYAAGTSISPAQMFIYDKKGEKIVEAESKRFLISNFQQVDAEKTKVSFFFMDPGRPIRHPSLTFSYNFSRRQVKMTREDNVEAKIPIMSEFFKMNFYVDQVIWNIDSNFADLNSTSVNAQLPTFFESYNYYQEGIENKYKQFLDYDPLMLIAKYCESMDSREVDADDLAGMMRAKDALTIEKFLFKMMEDGYLYYNRETGMVSVFDKLILHSMAGSGEVDYDNIRFASNTRGKVGKVLFDKRQIEIYGVEEMKISKSRNMIITPTSDTVYIGENRSLTVKGILTAGKVNFYAKNLQFNYDEFLFVMDNIDSMLIMVPTGEIDKYGNVYLSEINTPIQSISGKLFIDDPSNRSGKKNFSRYPYFICNDSSYVYYDQGGKGFMYPKDSFYFLLYPFEFESMSTFETESLRFKGEFVSGGIFPTFNSEIGIQENLTLGFDIETPENGLEMFSEEGLFRGNLQLDSEGLKGKGTISKKSLDFTTDNTHLFPDSIYAFVTSWTGKQDKTADLPEINGGKGALIWNPANDSIFIQPEERQIVKAYDNQADISGLHYKIIDDKLYTSGEFDVSNGHFTTEKIWLRAYQLEADTTDIYIRKIAVNEPYFSAKKVNTKFDFEKKEMAAVAPDSGSNAILHVNLLNTNTKQYTWDFANSIITFNNATTDKKQYFEFEETMLKGLRFTAKSSVLNIEEKRLNASGVSQINVADSKVIPPGNELEVTQEGTISAFAGATVIFNADSSFQTITDATVDITSQQSMTGSGNLSLVVRGVSKNVKIESFNTSSITTMEDKGKGKQEPVTRHYVKARGIIPEEDNYKLDSRISYKGDLLFSSMSKQITLDGFAHLELNTNPNTEWFKLLQNIDLQRAYFEIDSLQNEYKQPAYTGLALDMNEFIIYPRIIQSKENTVDRMIYQASGVMKYVPETSFAFAKQSVVEKPAAFAEIMKYDDASGLMDIYGNFNLADNIEPAKLNVYGSTKYRQIDTTSTFQIQGTAALDFYLTPEINGMLAKMMLDYNASAPTIQLANNKIYSAAIDNLIPNKNTAAGVTNDMEKFNVLNIPMDFGYNIVLSDLKFFYDQIDGTFKSLNPASLLAFTGKPIQQKINTFIEIGPRSGKDFINLYLQTSSGEWFFFRYAGGDLGIVTSDDRFNSLLAATKPERRILKVGKEKIYEFLPGSVALKDSFLARMEEFRERLLNP